MPTKIRINQSARDPHLYEVDAFLDYELKPVPSRFVEDVTPVIFKYSAMLILRDLRDREDRHAHGRVLERRGSRALVCGLPGDIKLALVGKFVSIGYYVAYTTRLAF